MKYSDEISSVLIQFGSITL